MEDIPIEDLVVEMALSMAICAVAHARGTLPSYEANCLAAAASEDGDEGMEDVAEVFQVLSDSYRRQGY